MKIRVRASALFKESYKKNYLVRYNQKELPNRARALWWHIVPFFAIAAGITVAVLLFIMDNTPSFLLRPVDMRPEDYLILSFVMKVVICLLIGLPIAMFLWGYLSLSTYATYFRQVPQGKVVEMYLGVFQTPRITVEGFTRANKLCRVTYSVDRKYWDTVDIGDFIKIQ